MASPGGVHSKPLPVFLLQGHVGSSSQRKTSSKESQVLAAAVCPVGIHGNNEMRGYGGHPQRPYSLDNQSVSTDQRLVASPKSLLEMCNLRHHPSPIKSKSDFKTSLGNKYTQQSLGSSGLQGFCKYSHSFNRH